MTLEIVRCKINPASSRRGMVASKCLVDPAGQWKIEKSNVVPCRSVSPVWRWVGKGDDSLMLGVTQKVKEAGGI